MPANPPKDYPNPASQRKSADTHLFSYTPTSLFGYIVGLFLGFCLGYIIANL